MSGSLPPPPKPPKPGQVKVVRALYNYTAQYPDELSFEEGDILYVSTGSVTDPEWLKAKCGGRSGLIPSNYVEESAEVVENPVHDAAKRGNLDFLRECLTNGVSVNGLDKAGSTPLIWASHGGHVDCMVALLQFQNIELNIQNKLGDTALHAAAWKGHGNAVELLLSYGIDVNIVNNDGKTALDLARDPHVVDLIMKHQNNQPNYDTQDYFGEEDEDSD